MQYVKFEKISKKKGKEFADPQARFGIRNDENFNIYLLEIRCSKGSLEWRLYRP